MKKFYRLFIVAVIGFLIISSGALAVPQEGAQYDYRRWSCKIEKEKAQETTQMKVTIFNQRGDDYNNIVLSENRFVKVKNFSLRVLDSAGNVITTKKFSDLIKTCGFGDDYQVYSDICYYSYEVSYPKYPYSIEYQYTNDIRSLMFWDGQYFRANIPVINTSYELIFPTEFQFDYKTYGMQVELSKSEEKGMQKWVWESDSLVAYKDVDYAPADYPEWGRLVFRPNSFTMEGYKFSGKEWRDIGKWYADLTRDRFLKPEADSILSSSSGDDKSDQLKRIYDKVVNDNRYVSVIIGISGWRPNDAALVAQRGYGDCKDLSTLLISRLRNAGYMANPVLVLTRGAGKIDLDFPSFRFNHVITEVMVGDGTILMDPTCHNCPFDEIPPGDENIPVLVVNDSGGYIRMTPSSKIPITI